MHEILLCTRHHAKSWKYGGEQKHMVPDVKELNIWWQTHTLIK